MDRASTRPPGDPPDRTTRPVGLAAAVVVIALVLGLSGVAIASARRDPSPDLRASVAADPRHPLRGEVRVHAAEPAQIAVEVRGPNGGFRVLPPGPFAGGELDVPLLGLQAASTYEVTVRATAGDATRTVLAGRLETGALPDDLPPTEVATAGHPNDSLTLFDASPNPPSDARGARDQGYLVVVDGSGAVVWYHAEEQPIQDAQRTARGTLLYVYDETGARERLPTGELVREWSGTTALDEVPEDDFGRRIVGPDAVRVETDQMHHEIAELPNGNLMTLSREVRVVEFPGPVCADEPFDGTYALGGDVIVEFDPDTGEVVREVSLFDLLDPLDRMDRLNADEFCSSYLERRYPGDTPVRDWTHANAVVFDERRNALLVSVRHLDTVVAVRYTTDEDGPAGELLWELGEDADFDLEGGGEWFLHQHAPEVRADGSILLYDNGNARDGTSLDDPDRLPYSRAVAYRLDEDARSVVQTDEYRFPAASAVYAPYVGDADDTGAGTVLIAHGGLLDPLAHSPAVEGVLRHARIVEVDADDPAGGVHLDLNIRDPAGEVGWRVYRAERIPTLYPAGYRVVDLP